MNADLSLFFGRFHPLIVHLPIGILLFAALLEMLSFIKKSAKLELAIKIALLTGAFSAVLAALSGYSLSSAGGYDEQTLFWHQWLGILIGVLALVAWWVKKSMRLNVFLYKATASQWIALGIILLIGITGHLGGSLTHGNTYLTTYMPKYIKVMFVTLDTLQSKAIIPDNIDSIVAFKHLVQPMLQAKCVSCHNPDKAQGGLVLTSEAAILKGGKSGPGIVPMDLKESELIRRITLPHTSTKFMPANNLPPLSNVEVSILKWWVSSGADFKNKLSSIEADEKIKYLLSVYLGLDPEAKREIKLPEVTVANPAAIKELKEVGILARPISENSNLLDVSFVMAKNASIPQRQEQLKKMLKIKKQVYWLDVSNCGLNNEDIKVLSQFPNLIKLSLQKNNVSDLGIRYLQDLKKLEYLNIYQNPLTDKSIQAIQQLPSLKKINLWQTQVTEKGIADLTSARKGLIVNY